MHVIYDRPMLAFKVQELERSERKIRLGNRSIHCWLVSGKQEGDLSDWDFLLLKPFFQTLLIMSENALNSFWFRPPTSDHQLGCVCGEYNTFLHCKLQEMYMQAGSVGYHQPHVSYQRFKRVKGLCAFGGELVVWHMHIAYWHIMHACLLLVSGLLLC